MMLDAVVNYLPSPVDIPPVEGIDPEQEGPARDRAQGLRRRAVQRARVQDHQRPARQPHVLPRLLGQDRERARWCSTRRATSASASAASCACTPTSAKSSHEADSGNIYAAVGLRDTRTGDTLCDEKHPILLEKMIFPEPVISIAIEPKTKVDVEKLGVGLQKLAAEDPSFRMHTDEESGQTIISGMGELHLEIIVDRLKREFKVESNVGKPEVAYREAITKKVACEYKYAKQSGGRGQYGHVRHGDRARRARRGLRLRQRHRRRRHPQGVHPGDREGRPRGDGARRPRRLPARRHERAASTTAATTRSTRARRRSRSRRRSASRTARSARACVLLEPIMKIEVVVPEQYMGDVIGDLNSRRGRILGMSQRGNAQVIDAEVPLATMFGYVTDLRSMTQGRGTSSMHFSHYAPVPPAIQEEIVAKVKGTRHAAHPRSEETTSWRKRNSYATSRT